MDHRQPRRGYHIRSGALLVGAGACVAALVVVVSCVTPVLAPVPPAGATLGAPWQEERRVLLEAINAARSAAGVAPLAYSSLLERVGTLHCQRLLVDGVAGHFALDGVPPYARYLLAGGHGYHRENAASRSSSYDVPAREMRAVLLESLDRMLAERPPNDGHRRTLLDRSVTHIGLGIAVQGGEVRVAHELAVEVATAWNAAPTSATPRRRVSVSGRLARPWEVAAVEVLWEPLPRPISAATAERLTSYAYPRRRSITHVTEPSFGRFAAGLQPGLEVYRNGAFFFTWATGPEPGLEVVLVWARRMPGQRQLEAVAASCTVVTESGELPAELARWAALRETDD